MSEDLAIFIPAVGYFSPPLRKRPLSHVLVMDSHSTLNFASMRLVRFAPGNPASGTRPTPTASESDDTALDALLAEWDGIIRYDTFDDEPQATLEDHSFSSLGDWSPDSNHFVFSRLLRKNGAGGSAILSMDVLRVSVSGGNGPDWPKTHGNEAPTRTCAGPTTNRRGGRGSPRT